MEQYLISLPGFSVRQILSGQLDAAVGYCEDEDEWALVVTGGASLTIAGEPVELIAGDWVWLPRGTEHRVERTEAGTSWVTVHLSR